MSYNITATPKFRKELKKLVKKYHSLISEYEKLLDQLENNASLGEPLGMDCFKIRMSIASKNKGKSGGARVITYVYYAKETIFLIDIYDKGNQANISNKELLELLKHIK